LLPGVSVADDWSVYGGDNGGRHYSELQTINRENVADLKQVWSFRHGELEDFDEPHMFASWHVTPILLPAAAGQSLIICTPFNRIIALDPTIHRLVVVQWPHNPTGALPTAAEFDAVVALVRSIGTDCEGTSALDPTRATSTRDHTSACDRESHHSYDSRGGSSTRAGAGVAPGSRDLGNGCFLFADEM
jgi:hypothetical protein